MLRRLEDDDAFVDVDDEQLDCGSKGGSDIEISASVRSSS